MTDPRYPKLADLLINYSTSLQRGENILLDMVDVPDEFTVELMRAARALVAAERALDEEGVPFSLVEGDDAKIALSGARFVFVPSSCGIGTSINCYFTGFVFERSRSRG